MYDLISIGTMVLDLYYQGNSLPERDGRLSLAIGGKYFVNNFHESLGGGGANVAIGAQNHGLKTAIMAKIGDNMFKRLLIEELKKHGVDQHYLQIEDDYLNISSVLLNEAGERTIVNYQTPHQKLIADTFDLNTLCKTKMIYLGNLPDVSLTERIRIIRHVKQHNVLTVLNLGAVDCKRELDQLEKLIQYVDILILNGNEFSELTKQPYDSLDFSCDVTAPFDFLHDKIVVTTLGKNGSYAYANDEIYFHEPATVEKIVDTTGAGDGYTSAFISTYLRTKNIDESMQAGTKYAGKILSKLGAN